jgi:hypothetical protein
MDKQYRFTLNGTAAHGQTWQTDGVVECDFADVFHTAMRYSFAQLTDGKAIYGKPGIGCNGPYDIHRVLIEQVLQ